MSNETTIGEDAVLRRSQIAVDERCGTCDGYGYEMRTVTFLKRKEAVQCRFCVDGRRNDLREGEVER